MHENSLVHGDVKPKNIVVSDDLQSVKIIDFGSTGSEYSPNYGMHIKTCTKDALFIVVAQRVQRPHSLSICIEFFLPTRALWHF